MVLMRTNDGAELAAANDEGRGKKSLSSASLRSCCCLPLGLRCCWASLHFVALRMCLVCLLALPVHRQIKSRYV